MSWTRNKIIKIADLVDLPGHDEVMAFAKKSVLWPKIIYPIAAAIISYFILKYAHATPRTALSVALVFGFSGFLSSVIFDVLDEKYKAIETALTGLLAVVGLFGAVFYQIDQKQDWLSVVLYGGAFALGGAIIGLVLPTALKLISGLLQITMNLVAAPISWPILKFMAYLNNRRMRIQHKEWINQNGLPLLVFNMDGLYMFDGMAEPILVAYPSMRRNGRAGEEGIPKFTYAELQNLTLVKSRIQSSVQSAQSTDAVDDSHWSNSFVNTALIGGTLGGTGALIFDDHSLIDINPASGLPTVAGIGSQDVAGNSWGTTDHQF